MSFTGAVPSPAPQASPLSVLVTGAARGIGFELVHQYLQAHPSNVVFAGVRDPEAAPALIRLAAAHPTTLHVIPMDVSNADSVQASLHLVQAQVDHLDHVINNAGQLGDPSSHNPLTATPAHLLFLFTTNVVGAQLVTQTFLPLLLRSPQPKVANVTSRLGSNAFANRQGPKLGYGVSKAALNYLTTAWRFAAPEVTFLALHPGWVATEMGSSLGKAPVQPHEAAQAIRYYISEKTISNSGEYVDVVSGSIIPH